MSEQRLYTLKGWCRGARHQDTAESLEEAILFARWAHDADDWAVFEIIDPDGKVVMTRDEIWARGSALTSAEVYGP